MIRAGRQTGLVVGAAAALLAALLLAATGGGGDAQGAQGAEGRPNVVVIMTDDQDLASMRVLPKTRRLIGDRGTTFTDNFASNPVCCPSRSTFFSGRYSHNTGVFRNSPPHGGFADFHDANTLPVWLQDSGYYTALIGKYMNGYGARGDTYIPPGWSEWYGATDPSTYRMYGYTLNENGTPVTYGDYDTPDPDLYQTAAITRSPFSRYGVTASRRPCGLRACWPAKSASSRRGRTQTAACARRRSAMSRTRPSSSPM